MHLCNQIQAKLGNKEFLMLGRKSILNNNL